VAAGRLGSVTAATTRKAWATMARVTHRDQERQRRTWCWTLADQALAGLESLLHRPPAPGDADQGGQRHRTRDGAAGEGQLVGPLVAAEHAPVLACLASGSRAVVQAEERPVVEAVAVGAGAARPLLPCPRRDALAQGVGTTGGAAAAEVGVAGHRQHLADLAGLEFGPEVGFAP
jgi:hypothetical protein